MELHTLGVNGGYTQKHVTEVARVLTGWTLKQPRQGGGFTFEQRMHESGDKNVLGHRIKASGEKEGREMLHISGASPFDREVHFNQAGYALRVGQPSSTLVDRMTQTFLKKNGDIREVLKTMFHSSEFWASDSYRAKVKTPLEFVISAVRASGAEVSDALPLARSYNHGDAALWHAASDGILHERRCLGKLRRAVGSNELRAGTDWGKTERRASGFRSHPG